MRLPLAKAVVAAPDATLIAPHLDILRDELNVKQVELTTDVDRFGTKELILNPKTLGPRLGGRTQDVIKAHKAGDWQITPDGAVVGGVELRPDEFDFRVVSAGDGAVAALKAAAGSGRARHDGDARARARGARSRPDPADPAGPPRRRPRRVRSDPSHDQRGTPMSSPPSRPIAQLVTGETLATVGRCSRRRPAPRPARRRCRSSRA